MLNSYGAIKTTSASGTLESQPLPCVSVVLLCYADMSHILKVKSPTDRIIALYMLEQPAARVELYSTRNALCARDQPPKLGPEAVLKRSMCCKPALTFANLAAQFTG